MALHNRVDKRVLKERIQKDETPRKTISFYRYVHIPNPEEYRDELYRKLESLDCLGRIYLAKEGVNAQMSVPENHWSSFNSIVEQDSYLKGVPFKIAVEDDGKSFYKLKIKVREKIVADGLDDNTFNPWNTGNHLSAEEFNRAIDEGAIVVDMRNHYESEVGHFEGAILPDADTFRDELKMVETILDGKKKEKILMYCTGGIRCEKASVVMLDAGFTNVKQLKGGILGYFEEVGGAHWNGDCFVFDHRVALNPELEETEVTQCYACREPLSVEEQQSEDYQFPISCPYCIDRAKQKEIIERQKLKA